MNTRKKCVTCGREYKESNGYGVCFQCDESINHNEREIHYQAIKKKRGEK